MKSEEHYNNATKLVNGDTSMFESRKYGSKLERRVFLNRMIANASYVLSILAFEMVCFPLSPYHTFGGLTVEIPTSG